MLEPLLRTAAAVGLDLDVSSSKALADSLDRAVVSDLQLLFSPFFPLPQTQMAKKKKMTDERGRGILD